MTDRAFRFGVVGTGTDLATWTDLARRAEAAGYDTLVSPDPQVELDPFTIMSAAAAVTTTLHVGTFVAVDQFRERRSLDWQSRSLHQFTGGRFELGLGAGRPDAKERVVARGGSWERRFSHLTETIEFLKKQSDRPPLLLAPGGPKMTELAAREADIATMAWMPRTTEADARSTVDRFRSVCDRLDEVELAANLLAVGDEPAPWLERFIGASLPELAAGGAVTVLPGTPEQGAETLRRWRAELGISYVTVNSGYLDQFARVIALLK
ncbi:LLM class flavin-dependent oxidoreductase [Amycolatopsis alkalitolerans]|uniref:LLM class flavin-dependent oxidoreductase n=1 Tax=Amycolatopsis alkalitolerans TaxID=2547244 RepID=A0A5C4M831_9PSEU|nr:LLM class flavin-dependent oxidoreductase [Amycolatopsis alkalitolerans]TNC28221.1 LLM class flavin-dependent oxidoreductase [Amycolatopsis alkalitolerans]